MRRLLPLLLALLATPAAAFEPTGNAVADGFLRIVESGGFDDVAFAAAQRADRGTVLTGLSASARNERLEIGTVVIVDGLIDADNGLRAEAIQYRDMRMTNTADAASHSTAGMLTLARPHLPMRDGGGSWLETVLGDFESLLAQDVAARPAAGRALEVGRIEVTRADEGGPWSGRVAFQAARVDAAFFQGTAGTYLTDLGYDTLTISGALEGLWSAGEGTLAVREASLAADGVGALVVSGAAEGLSAERIAAIRDNAGALPQMLPLLTDVRLESLTLAFRDGGLVQRLVTRTVERSGDTVEKVRSDAVATVDSLLALVGVPALQAQVTDAVRRFLANPGTLAVNLAPPASVNAAQIVGGALLKPDALPQLLNFSISATP
ncbi:hypothetical protein DLJ53_15045 [Acuticoccus sediminis]|uniref:DUF2125 domain-containing protein n=1 Tax=Acuticoccus sediminis TaxID=2184697 RepID=A0A8B2NLV2_9HYPH|nr:hypothetical protein [Acuticoccus sediminis]RAI00577.1 hypothetical protein DLJ53_15045 [Acuticoccus sediminis]